MDRRTPLYVLLSVGAVFVLALALFGSGSETVTESTTTTFADIPIPDPPSTTTTRPRATEVVPEVRVITDLSQPSVSGLERLVAVVGQGGTGHTLVVVDHPTGERVEIPLHRIAFDFSLDASGTVLSYLGGDDYSGTRWLVPLDGSAEPVPMGAQTSSFVWSGDEPLIGAWLEPEIALGGRRIVLGEFTDGRMINVGALGTTSGSLAGINSTGYWTTGDDSDYPRVGFVEFRERDSDHGWGTSADLVIPAASSRRALLAHLDTASWRWNFGVGPDRIEPLSWAPGDAGGEYGFAAFSPNGVRIAFIGGSGDRGLGWLEIHSTVGGPVPRIVLPYRVWDVRWSERGDFVVMPGTDNRGTHVVVLVDARVAFDQEPFVYAVEMDDWVQFAAVVDLETVGVSAGGAASN